MSVSKWYILSNLKYLIILECIQKQWLSSTLVIISAYYFNELSYTNINKLGSIADYYNLPWH
jgi:hypothetical protein